MEQEDLWFNKAGKLSKGQQRIIKRANSNKSVDKRNQINTGSIYAPYIPFMTPEQELAIETERINRIIQSGKDMEACIGKYKVAPCVDDYMRETAVWMKGGRKSPMPVMNECVANASREGEGKKKMTKAQTAEFLQRKQNEKTLAYSGLSENIEYAPQVGIVPLEKEYIGRGRGDMGIPNLKRKTCDEMFNEVVLTNGGLVREHLKVSAIQCLSQCAESRKSYRDQANQIKDMESSPQYENSIQEYGKEYTDIRIANKKAGLCAQKKILAWQCKEHIKEDGINKYLPYILGGMVLLLVLKK